MARLRVIAIGTRAGLPQIDRIVRWERLHLGEQLGYYADGAVILCDPLEGTGDGLRQWAITGAVEHVEGASKQDDFDETTRTRLSARGYVEGTIDGRQRFYGRSLIAGDPPVDTDGPRGLDPVIEGAEATVDSTKIKR